MPANKNGRPQPEGHGTPDATGTVQGATATYPQDSTFVRPMGATPFTRVEVIDARDWMTEPADMGDALALDAVTAYVVVDVPGDVAVPQSYRYRWYWDCGVPS